MIEVIYWHHKDDVDFEGDWFKAEIIVDGKPIATYGDEWHHQSLDYFFGFLAAMDQFGLEYHDRNENLP